MSHFISALILLTAVGCASTPRRGLIDALGHWRSGRKTMSVAAARREYQRFVQANEIEESKIRQTVELATERLDNEPVVSDDEMLLRPPSPVWLTKEKPDPNELTSRLQHDLLSHSSTRVMKALVVVKTSRLAEHAALVLHIIYDQIPMDAADRLMEGLSPAHRTLAVKRFAVDTLEAL